jgi:hypothetical protein
MQDVLKTDASGGEKNLKNAQGFAKKQKMSHE